MMVGFLLFDTGGFFGFDLFGIFIAPVIDVIFVIFN